MLYIFEPDSKEWIVREMLPGSPLPYARHSLLSVDSFRSRSTSNLIWTDMRAIKALDLLLALSDTKIVRYAFRRIGEAVHTGQSAHYAGLAFDLGYRLSLIEQLHLAELALTCCGFERVEPLSLTPGWLHVEKLIAEPASLKGGYPLLKLGDRGVHVFVLQDALLRHEMLSAGITGCFCSATAFDVRRFQTAFALEPTGKVNALTWEALMR